MLKYNINRVLKLFILLFVVKMVDASERHLTILYTGDLPQIASNDHGDYAQLATLLEKHRSQPDPVLFLFGGSSIGPSSLSGFDHGAHIIDILNNLEPDAMGVGKSDFSFFEDELSLRAYEAAFPLVTSNMFDPQNNGNIEELATEVLVDKQGIKIGILSIINESVIEEYLLHRVKVLDPFLSVQTKAAELRQRGADIVVLMHQLTYPFITDLLSDGVIDLSFTLVDIGKYSKQEASLNNMIILDKQGDAALVKLTLSPDNNIIQIHKQEIELASLEKHPTINEHVQDYNQRLLAVLNEAVITIPEELDSRRVIIRTRQTPFTNLLADALKASAHAQIAIINAGVVRGNRVYQAGTTLTNLDIAAELPYRSRVAVINLKGRHLIEALENGFSLIENEKGRFPSVSGIKVTYNPQAKVGHRVKQVLFNDAPIELEQVYKVATTDYLADGGDGYMSLKQGVSVQITALSSPLVSDIFIDYLRSTRQLNFKLDSRLVVAHDQ